MKLFIIACVVMALASVLRAADENAPPPAKAISPATVQRAKDLKVGIKTFSLNLRYIGPQDKPFYHLNLSVTPVNVLQNDFFHFYVTISEDQATRLIDWLAVDGFLDKAQDIAHGRNKSREIKGPVYIMTASAQPPDKRIELTEELGWDLAMLHRLDGFQKVLDKEPAEKMNFLINRLSGFRKEWEKAKQ